MVLFSYGPTEFFYDSVVIICGPISSNAAYSIEFLCYFIFESTVKFVFKVGGLNDLRFISAPVLLCKLLERPIWFIPSALR
jgi:hypothetical protein